MVLNTFNIILHTIGSSSLISLYPNCIFKTQRLYIINLSVTTALLNSLELIKNITVFLETFSKSIRSIERFQHYILIIEFTGVSFVYYVTMIVLTLDRLAGVRLGLKYQQYWNETKTKYLVGILWMSGSLIAIGVSLAFFINDLDWEHYFYKYFYPILELSFILIALATYGFIFCERTKNIRKLSTMSGEEPADMKAKLTEFKKSFFFVPSLLILTFVLFMIVPDFVYLFIVIKKKKPSETLGIGCWISYATSNIIDAGVYIYFLSDVRKYLLKKIGCGQESVTRLKNGPFNENGNQCDLLLHNVQVL